MIFGTFYKSDDIQFCWLNKYIIYYGFICYEIDFIKVSHYNANLEGTILLIKPFQEFGQTWFISKILYAS